MNISNPSDREEEAMRYYDSIGPWATGLAVRTALGVSASTLSRYRKHHRLLGVSFGRRHKFFYPMQQFMNGRVIPGLKPVLDALSVGFSSPEGMAGWLAERAYEGSTKTRWDVLRSGDVQTVVEWAEDDSRLLNRP